MKENNRAYARGMTFFDGLQLLLIGLKLAGVIDWPWWLVFAPFLALAGIIVLLLVLLFIKYMLD